jgi:hypothetical protein
MKYVKMLGLAAVAAMALMAFVGAGSASATVLCKTTTTPCGGGHISLGETITAHSTHVELRSTGGAFQSTCKKSTVSGPTTTTGSSTTTVKGSVAATALTWGECSEPVETLEGGNLEIHHITGTHNGTLTASGFKVKVTIAGVGCKYSAGAGTDLGTVTGGASPTLHINAIVNEVEPSFFCPDDAVWTGNYVSTTPVHVTPS